MGKTYVISDIHAHMAPLAGFLRSINDDDIVYILGDIVDKGPDGLDPFLTILDDLRCILILGNHELMAAWILRRLCVEVTEDNYDTHVDEKLLEAL